MPQNRSQEEADSLEALAKAQFGRELTAAEGKLLSDAPLGYTVYCGPSEDPKDPNNDPSKAEKREGNPGWGRDREIDASLIRWLCVDRNAKEKVDPFGIHIQAAKVTGNLNLQLLALPFSVRLLNCALTEDAWLYQMKMPLLDLGGCWTKSVDASGAVLGGSVVLSNGFHAEGEVSLFGAQIDGLLDCGNSTFSNAGGIALNAELVRVSGSTYLRHGFSAEGKVRFGNAQIGGNLECDGAVFSNPWRADSAADSAALNAESASVKGSVLLRNGFRAKGGVWIMAAQIGMDLDCGGGTFKNPGGEALVADRTDVKGNIFLSALRAEGKVSLVRAQIGADLVCDGGTFNNPGGEALVADRIDVKGTVFLGAASAEGTVRFTNAQIGGNLECDGGVFSNPWRADFPADSAALNAESAAVKGSVYLRNGFRAKGEVGLLLAQIGADLDCGGGTFNNPGASALIAERTTVRGSVFLRNGFSAEGEVSILGAQVGGDFDCGGGTFKNPGGDALNADGTYVKGSVFLNAPKKQSGEKVIGFSAEGKVRFITAQILGNFECDHGVFSNSSKPLPTSSPADGAALLVEDATVKGSVYLRNGFRAKGGVVWLLGSQIGGDLDCRDGTFNNPDGEALNAARISVKENVFLNRGFNAAGEVLFLNAHIEGDLDCVGGTLNHASLNLANASVARIRDDPDSWPNQLYLDGFVYTGIVRKVTDAGTQLTLQRLRQRLGLSYVSKVTDAETGLTWLALQPPQKPIPTQPYLQLAKVLRAAGDEDGAITVLERMEQRRRQVENEHRPDRQAISWFFKEFAGYGYDPARSVLAILGLTGLGWILYRRSYLAGGMVPTEKDIRQDFIHHRQTPSHYEAFSPLIYSLENSLPLVKLGQADKWQPNPDPGDSASRKGKGIKRAGRDKPWPRLRWLERLLIFLGLLAPAELEEPRSPFARVGASPQLMRWFLWFQILLGWLLATLFLAGVSGIVHKD